MTENSLLTLLFKNLERNCTSYCFLSLFYKSNINANKNPAIPNTNNPITSFFNCKNEL